MKTVPQFVSWEELPNGYCPKNNVLYRYTRRTYAESFARGSVRLNPVRTYSQMEEVSGSRLDEKEGFVRKDLIESDLLLETPQESQGFQKLGPSTIMNTQTGSTYLGNAFKGFSNPLSFFGGNAALVRGCSFEGPNFSPASNFYAFCFAYDKLSRSVLDGFANDPSKTPNALVIVQDWESFFCTLAEEMIDSKRAVDAYIGDCVYSNDENLFEIPRAFQKQNRPDLVAQKEVRMVFLTESEPSGPLEFELPELSRFVSGIENC